MFAANLSKKVASAMSDHVKDECKTHQESVVLSAV